MLKSESDKQKPKEKKNINKIKKKVLKKKSSHAKCSYKKCNGKNCSIKNILSSWILVKEIINDKIRIYPAHLSSYNGGFEKIDPSSNNLCRQLSCDKTLYFRELIENMSPSDIEDVKTKEEFLASIHN